MGGISVGKVVAFVTRPGPAGPELLVFDHPSAGVQVPAGTLDPGEEPVDGARREAWEETGLDRLRLVQSLGSWVESREGDGRGRLAQAVEIDGEPFGRGRAASLLDRRAGSVLVEVGTHRGWVTIDAVAVDVVRHFFHFVSEVEIRDEWWVVTPDGGGLCWRCRWAPLSAVRLVDGQHEWLLPVRDRLAALLGPSGPSPAVPLARVDERYSNATTVEVFWTPPPSGRRTLMTWLSPDEVEPPDTAERALAVCFTVDGRVVLVSGDGPSAWTHPGGGREQGESVLETLHREVYEEACARVLASKLIGYDRFVEVDSAGTVQGVSLQARFAARVALEPFVARHETTGRQVVEFDQVVPVLAMWQPDSLGRLMRLAGEASVAAGWLVVELTTTRPGLSLRELTEADSAAYYALVDRNRAHLTRYGDFRGMATITPDQVSESLAHPVDDNTRFGVWLDGDLIGRIDLNPINPPNYVLGVWLDEAATGTGYATDACRSAIDFARTRLGATDMWAGVTHGNEPSVNLLSRLGFARVAEMAHHIRFDLALDPMSNDGGAGQ